MFSEKLLQWHLGQKRQRSVHDLVAADPRRAARPLAERLFDLCHALQTR